MNYNVDLNLYKTFYIVSKYKNFTKASQELYVSQPAVTQSIKKLEEQLNVKLFERTQKGIELTKAGEVAYYYAEKIFDLASANSNLVERVQEAAFKEINIGVPTHIGTFFIIDYLKKFNIKHPNVRVNIINKKSDEMQKMLVRRELDIIIDTDIEDYNKDLIKCKKLLDLHSCFVCNENFKEVAQKGLISVQELSKYPLILPGKTTFNRKIIDKNFEQKNIILNPIIEANSSSISKGIIYEGIGIGWMIKEFVEKDIENGSLYEVKVDVDTVLTSVNIAYNREFNHDIVKDFIKMF